VKSLFQNNSKVEITLMTRSVVLLTLVFLAGSWAVPPKTCGAGRGEEQVGDEFEDRQLKKVYQALHGRFFADRNEIVTDMETGLQWFVGPDRDTSWDEAKAWVDGLARDGGRWRMPTKEELEGLYVEGLDTHNISPLFKTSAGFVWTDESVGSNHVWGFCFDIGGPYWPRRTFRDAARAFAVRPLKYAKPGAP
jgi:hypothetical protein